MEKLNKDRKVDIYIEKDNVQFTDYFRPISVFPSGSLLTNFHECDIKCRYDVTS